MNQDRLATVTGELVTRLHQAVRDLKITESELHAALAFLTRVGKAGEFILLSDVLKVSVLVDAQTHGEDGGEFTPHNVEGPLYRPSAPLIPLGGSLCGEDELGEPLLLRGRVMTGGQPLAGAEVDIWQTNEAGAYENQDPGQAEFNLRGRQVTGATGEYAVRTIVPGPYRIGGSGPVGDFLTALGRHDWRPAHIHVKVSAAGHVPLTTMLFVPGDPYLASDAIGAVKSGLVAEFARREGSRETTCEFDFALRRSR
jgi:protocatechuate 3,4-dioxygenase beta subunit